ncbi:MAG: calcium/proton exchanger [Acidobacteria bacterium]|nr:calcium/proton exchanger [Acidobacteriota bacterium]
MRARKIFTGARVLNALLVFVPAALALEYVAHAGSVYVFITSALAIVPLAGMMGRATESLAERLGEGPGGLLNATFGNAAELIIAVLALRAGLHDLVKASITGSIIGNILFVFGLSALAGGLRYQVQSFNRTAAGMGSTMLFLSAISLVVPAVFDRVVHGNRRMAEREMSLEIAIVLIICYVLSLIFTLRTHRHLYAGGSAKEGAGTMDGHGWSIRQAAAVLLGSSALVALMSELLVGAAEEAGKSLGMNEVFLGVILVAIIGNAAEHSTAVMTAWKNKMDIAINIAVGSSIQIALFVAPVIVFLSYWIGPSPMNLLFTMLEVVAVVLAAGIMALITQDGETNWMEGVQLLAVYLILGIAFYFLQ